MAAEPTASTDVTDRPGAPRHVRRVLALLLVAALAVPALTAGSRVTVEVDGETVRLRTYGDTVQDALAAADVEVGPRDKVVPGGDTPVRDGIDVEVLRAQSVALEYRGHIRVLPVAGETVEDVLVAAGLGEVEGVSIAPDPDTPLEQVDRVAVVRPVTVRIDVDDHTKVVRLGQGGTVGDALDVAGVTLDQHDKLSLPRSRDLSGHAGEAVEVTVRRIERDRVVEKVELPFDETVVETADRYVGERVVTQEGAPGLRRDVYRVTRTDGKVTDRTRVKKAVVRQPTDRVVEVGTAQRPAPEPEPAPAEQSSHGNVWERLAQCESGGNWHINTGNGYYGGLQFSLSTWRRVGGSGYPHEASKAEQIRRGIILRDRNGGSYSAWPACQRKLGLP